MESDEGFLDLLLRAGVIESKSEGRRLIEEGAVKNLETNEKMVDPFSKSTPGVYRVWKKRFI